MAVLVIFKFMTHQKGIVGEKYLWHFARESSPGNYVALVEVLGPQNVGESHWALQVKHLDIVEVFSLKNLIGLFEYNLISI